MSQYLYRSIEEPIRQNLSYAERWHGLERALVTCWEIGRQLRATEPELARRAEAGELPVTGWTGGVSAPLKGQKYGSLHYLSQWQGLRAKDLDIDLSIELPIVCSRTGTKVVFTADSQRWGR